MSNFSSLKAAIQQYIKTNGNEEITGAVLQDILLSMVSVLGDTAINDLETALQTETTNRTNADGTLQQNINNEATARGNADTALGNRLTTAEGAITTINTMLGEGYLYAGIATTSTNPGTPTGKVFYIATAAGTYTNFSGIELTQGVNILKYNGSVWSSEQVLAIDDIPTAGSNNLVKSGGVYNAMSKFVNNAPFVRELYLNSDAKTADVGMFHSVNSSGTVLFANAAGNSFTAVARGAQFNKPNILKVTGYPDETTFYGYIFIDLTGINDAFNQLTSIKDTAYNIENSPYLYTRYFKSGFDEGAFYHAYIDLNTSTHKGTLHYISQSGDAFVIIATSGQYRTSYNEGDTFDLPDTPNFIVVYDKKEGVMTTISSYDVVDPSRYILFGYYTPRGIIMNAGTILVNGKEKNRNDQYLLESIYEYSHPFVTGWPIVKELYINPLGVAADVGMLHSVNSSGTVLFAKTNGSAYSGIARGGKFGEINVLPIKAYPNETGQIWGYIVIDLTNISQQTNFTTVINDIAKDISYSPYIDLKYGTDTLEVGNTVGKIINTYDTIKTLAADGSGDYTTFRDAHSACSSASGKALMLIKTGTYDINPSDYTGNGPSVKYDIKGVGDVTLRCIYNGSDTSIRQNFSPINATNTPQQHQTVKMENIKIVVQGVRYCVHDEMGALATPSYTHIYKDCKFQHLSAPDSVWDSPRCIGGGLGNKALIIVDGCECESVIKNSIDYHTGHSGGAESSKVIIKNSTLPNNTVSCTSTLYASDLSIVVVQDCILNEQPYYKDDNGHKDMKLITRNNIIV